MKTLVRNGRILTSSQEYNADLLIDGERVAQIGTDLSGNASDRVIDASGKVVAPGGVDVHTHLESPRVGTPTSDDFGSGQIAAVLGGTTSHVEFAIQDEGESLSATVDAWLEKARGKACIDYGLHVAITDLNENRLSELPALVERGIVSFKLFMAYKGKWMVGDADILAALRACGSIGGLVMLHCENGDVIDALVRDAVSAGHREPRWHAATRPSVLEGEATNRATVLSTVADAPVYVVHVSCSEAVEAIAGARRRGAPVYGETCVQYLVLSDERSSSPGLEGAKFVCSPPVRGPEHAERLWAALREDELQIVATDHAPYTLAQKAEGLDSFQTIPSGLPTIEHRLPLLWEHGVRQGRLTANRWVQLVATNPAKRFGLYPQKGDLVPGADADLIVFDPEATQEISARSHHMNTDYSVFEGMLVSGVPDTVLRRGELIVDRGALVPGFEGTGRFLARRPMFGTEPHNRTRKGDPW